MRPWNCSGNCGQGSRVRLLGIRTSKLVEEGEPEQMTLFEFQADQEKEEKRQENLRKRERLERPWKDPEEIRG